MKAYCKYMKVICIFAFNKMNNCIAKFSSYGDTGNQTAAHPCNAPAALRVESRQAEPFKMSVPQRQNPKLTTVLQNPDGLLLLHQL